MNVNKHKTWNKSDNVTLLLLLVNGIMMDKGHRIIHEPNMTSQAEKNG